MNEVSHQHEVSLGLTVYSRKRKRKKGRRKEEERKKEDKKTGREAGRHTDVQASYGRVHKLQHLINKISDWFLTLSTI